MKRRKRERESREMKRKRDRDGQIGDQTEQIGKPTIKEVRSQGVDIECGKYTHGNKKHSKFNV